MGNIPGLSVEAGGTEDVAEVTQGIGWECVLLTTVRIRRRFKCRMANNVKPRFSVIP